MDAGALRVWGPKLLIFVGGGFRYGINGIFWGSMTQPKLAEQEQMVIDVANSSKMTSDVVWFVL